MSKKEVHIYTDGSAHNNGDFEGCGGYGGVLLYGDFQDVNMSTEYCTDPFMRVYGGSCNTFDTTNQREEMKAVIEGLKRINRDVPIKIYSDSAYIVNCMNDKWWEGWIRNGWKNSKKQPVANKDLWEEMLSLINENMMNVEFLKVKGHVGVYYNEMADDIADEFMEKSKQAFISQKKVI